MVKPDNEGIGKRYGPKPPHWMRKVPGLNWYKVSYDENGRWYNFKGKSEISIGSNLGHGNIRHVFNNGQTIFVATSKKEAMDYVQKYMRSHPNG